MARRSLYIGWLILAAVHSAVIQTISPRRSKAFIVGINARNLRNETHPGDSYEARHLPFKSSQSLLSSKRFSFEPRINNYYLGCLPHLTTFDSRVCNQRQRFRVDSREKEDIALFGCISTLSLITIVSAANGDYSPFANVRGFGFRWRMSLSEARCPIKRLHCL